MFFEIDLFSKIVGIVDNKKGNTGYNITMPTKFEKILNPRVLLSLNIFIIVATELSGKFFQEKGIIHLIAILFVVLGISRIFVHYDAYDRYLRLLIVGGSAALVIFSLSHLVEFLGYAYLKTYEDAIFVNVVNFYIMSILAVAIGAEYFLRTLKKNSTVMIGTMIAGIAIFIFLVWLIFSNKVQVSLEPDEPWLYVYGALVFGASFLSLSRLIKVKKHVSIMTGFINYFVMAFVLITVSSAQYVFYELIEKIGIPDFQIVYIGHFLFYGALSLMFLAFVRLTNLGGIYKEAEEYKNNHNTIDNTTG